MKALIYEVSTTPKSLPTNSVPTDVQLRAKRADVVSPCARPVTRRRSLPREVDLDPKKHQNVAASRPSHHSSASELIPAGCIIAKLCMFRL